MKHKYVYDDELLKYRFNDTHPFNQMRVKMTTDLLIDAGYLKEEDIIKPRKATDEELLLVHQREFLEGVKLAGEGKLTPSEKDKYGLNSEDTPAFHDMHDKSLMIVGATLTAVDEVMSGKAGKVLSLAGGLHHGFKGRASGFCIYNDSAVAIEYMRKNYNQKVLYIDTDAHHGDGTQFTFYNTNDVMTYSIHETGRYLFPGTGNITELGDDAGYGYSINLPIEAYTEDESFKYVFETSIRRAIEAFKPDIILSQNGVDSHYRDPMTHLNLTSESYEFIPRLVNDLAEEYTNGKWVAIGGGGYNMWQVVPRMWAQVWLSMIGEKPPRGDLPKSFIDKYEPKCKVKFPVLWEDDLADYMNIPRKEEISEKNALMLGRLLNHI